MKIKIYKQETNKSCGVACLRSIINSYGNNFSEKDILKKHNPWKPNSKEVRNTILSLSLTALKFGFKVKYIGYNPIIAANNTKKDLKESLKEKSNKNFSFGKFEVDTALKFLDLNGELVLDRLNVKKLKSILDKDKFFIVGIKPAFFMNNVPIDALHKVIVVGYDKTHFRMLNPSDGKEWKVNFDSFMMAFYSAVPEILIIKNK